jgi:hypothetical protein
MTRADAVAPPLSAAPIPPPRRLWPWLVHGYASADPRSLAVFRIALGCLLFVHVALYLPDVDAHFSNTGWLPNHLALFRPMSDYLFSVYLAFGTPAEVKLLLALHLLVCLLLAVGYRTRLMQIASFVLLTSLDSRNVLVENGGSVVLNLLLLWSLFLPLGRRFSVDALRASLRARHETSAAALLDRSDPPRDQQPVVSLAVSALILQWATIYFFNTIQKTGAPWRDGTAVYYFLQQDRLITWLGAWLRGALPLGAVKLLTYAALALEGSVALLLLLPWRPRLTRMLAFVLVLVLHLSIACVLRLGSFSWAMIVVFLAFVPTELWHEAERRVAARRTACVLHFDPSSGSSLALCRLIKRLDAFGLVTFRALDAESPEGARKTLVASVGTKSELGYDALLVVSDALWFGRLSLVVLGRLGLRKRVERRLAQMATDSEQLDSELGLDALPAQADAREPEPTEAALFWRRVSGGAREAAVLLLLVICGTQALLENQAVPSWLKPRHRPAWFEAVVTYPRIFQGWSMFAPSPPSSDSRLVIDGRTKSGRHLDPLTGHPPRFEVRPAAEPRMNLVWGYFHTRIGEDRFRPYWNGVRDFLLRHHKLTGQPDDELVAFDAYLVTETFPEPGQAKAAAQRRKLFSHGSMGVPGRLARPRAK